MITSDGYSWSHSDAASNYKDGGLKFCEGQRVTVAMREGKVVFTTSTQNMEASFSLTIPESDKGDLYFCVCLRSEGGAVEIESEEQ
jgi:hypothetical protein